MPSNQHIDVNNLITLQITLVMSRELNLCNWKLALINVRSLKSKEDLLFDYLKSANINLCVAMETWLREHGLV